MGVTKSARFVSGRMTGYRTMIPSMRVAQMGCPTCLCRNRRAPRVEELPAFADWSSMGDDADERLVRDRGIKDACLHIAKALISGELGVIEGCAAMAMFLSRLDSRELDERMRIFECVAKRDRGFARWTRPGVVGDWGPCQDGCRSGGLRGSCAGRSACRLWGNSEGVVQGLKESAPLPSRL